MSSLVHRLKGKIRQPSSHDKDVAIELIKNPLDENGTPILAVTTVDFNRENATELNEYVAAGASTSNKITGINEGYPYSVSIKDENGELEILDSHLKLNGKGVLWSCDAVKNIPVEPRGASVSIGRQMSNIRFIDLLNDGKLIPKTHYVQIGYVRSDLPNYEGAAIATFAAFVVIGQIRDIVKELTKVAAEIASIIGAISGILKIFVLVVWLIIVLAQIIIFIIQIANHLIQPVKYHTAMKWRTIFELGCAELGLTFKSSIFDNDFVNNTVEMPPKLQSFDDKNNDASRGFTVPNYASAGYPEEDFLTWTNQVKKALRAKVIIADGLFMLERIDEPAIEPVLRLPNVKLDEHSTNQEEGLKANYHLSFRIDESDNNTSDNSHGNNTYALTTVGAAVNLGSVLLDGNAFPVSLDYARATRKEVLTPIEKIISALYLNHSREINGMIKIVNIAIVIRAGYIILIKSVLDKLAIVGINIPWNPKRIELLAPVKPGQVQQRVGLLSIQNDYTRIKKIMVMSITTAPILNKLDSNSLDLWHSEYIYNFFHQGQSFQISARYPKGNQKRLFKSGGFHLCKEDIYELLRNDRVLTSEGVKVRVVSCRLLADSKLVESIELEMPYIDDGNLTTTLHTPTGI